MSIKEKNDRKRDVFLQQKRMENSSHVLMECICGHPTAVAESCNIEKTTNDYEFFRDYRNSIEFLMDITNGPATG